MAAASRYVLSQSYMAQAKRVIPRGTTSSRRAAQRPTPLVFDRARGSRIFDIDGNEYVDYVAGYGPLLLGHGFDPVDHAVIEQMSKGVLFGGQHEGERFLAELLISIVPSAEKVLLNVSGSEAAHAALRLARAATQRKLIIKFEGHYHGWIDPIATGEGIAGVATADPFYMFASDEVIVCPWNDPAAFQEAMTIFGDQVAGVILEPIAVNSGAMAPNPGYLEFLRELCTTYGSVLIFDEVVTGFRVALGGAQERYGVIPDLTILGKAIASGYPLSAVVGGESVMRAAEKEVAWAGTMNGQAIAVHAAITTLEHLRENQSQVYGHLEDISTKLVDELNQTGLKEDVPLVATNIGSILQLYWKIDESLNRYENMGLSDYDALTHLAELLIHYGVHSRENGMWYVSAAHSVEDIEITSKAVRSALEVTKETGGFR